MYAPRFATGQIYNKKSGASAYFISRRQSAFRRSLLNIGNFQHPFRVSV